MPLRIDVAPGTEFLLPFAKKKLADLKSDPYLINKLILVDSGEQIFVQRGIVDSIRITGGTRPEYVFNAPDPFTGAGGAVFIGTSLTGSKFTVDPTITLAKVVAGGVMNAIAMHRLDIADTILRGPGGNAEASLYNDEGFVVDTTLVPAGVLAVDGFQKAITPYIGTFSHTTTVDADAYAGGVITTTSSGPLVFTSFREYTVLVANTRTKRTYIYGRTDLSLVVNHTGPFGNPGDRNDTTQTWTKLERWDYIRTQAGWTKTVSALPTIPVISGSGSRDDVTDPPDGPNIPATSPVTVETFGTEYSAGISTWLGHSANGISPGFPLAFVARDNQGADYLLASYTDKKGRKFEVTRFGIITITEPDATEPTDIATYTATMSETDPSFPNSNMFVGQGADSPSGGGSGVIGNFTQFIQTNDGNFAFGTGTNDWLTPDIPVAARYATEQRAPGMVDFLNTTLVYRVSNGDYFLVQYDAGGVPTKVAGKGFSDSFISNFTAPGVPASFGAGQTYICV